MCKVEECTPIWLSAFPRKKITAYFDTWITSTVLVGYSHLAYNLRDNFFLIYPIDLHGDMHMYTRTLSANIFWNKGQDVYIFSDK